MKKGDPSLRCLPCAVKEQERYQRKKRKHDKEVTSPSESQEEPGSTITVERFTELLAELAHGREIDYSTCISMQGMVEEEDEIFKLIVKRVWEATGFRFMYVWFLLEA